MCKATNNSTTITCCCKYNTHDRDYIDLIKSLIIAFILIIPLLILTKINFISKPVAMAFSSFILILALLYIVYHLIFKQDAYLKRDKKNYDLIKIEDNMRHKKLVKLLNKISKIYLKRELKHRHYLGLRIKKINF